VHDRGMGDLFYRYALREVSWFIYIIIFSNTDVIRKQLKRDHVQHGGNDFIRFRNYKHIVTKIDGCFIAFCNNRENLSLPGFYLLDITDYFMMMTVLRSYKDNR